MSPLFLTGLFACVMVGISSQQMIVFDVFEEQPPPYLVGNVPSRMNISVSSGYKFLLLSPTDTFSIDPFGNLLTKVKLDAERTGPKSLNVTIILSTSSNDTNLSLLVNIVDINDQIPDFQVSSFSVRLSEKSPGDSTIVLPVAKDADYDPKNRVQNYSLQSDPQNTFDLVVSRNIQQDGSVILTPYLRLIKPLDRETTPLYFLTLMASDGEHTVRLPLEVIVMDVNDNAPAFLNSSYNTVIPETTTLNSLVLIVAATDPDEGENARVSYRLINSFNVLNFDKFAIVPETGDIKVVGSLDGLGGATVAFKVEAYDHGSPYLSSQVTVTVAIEDTVNDPPVIRVINYNSRGNDCLVKETDSSGQKIAVVVVSDSDTGNNGKTSCSLESDSFRLTYNAPQYIVSTSQTMDREQQAKYVVSIVCQDQGSPPLSSQFDMNIVVDDANDNPPIFTSSNYQLAVKENQRPLELVGKIFAMDADEGVNAQLRYTLEPGVTDFRINDTTGYLYTSRSLDRENISRYSFKVYASDVSPNPLNASATVVVDVLDLNDNAPQFSLDSYKFEILENSPLDTVLGQLNATDPDLGQSGQVEYLLTGYPSQPDLPFAISPLGGVLTLTGSVDYETEAHYNFKVVAMDGGVPRNNRTVEVWVDISDENDNPPVIAFPGPDNQTVVLNLGVSPGYEVIQVIAHDLDSVDNGRLTYSLNPANSSVSRLFWMNEDTGQLTLVAPLTVADIRTYNIVIGVHDNGQPQRATQALLRVDVVEQVPQARLAESYTTIVIIMVCVTLFVAVVVLVTLCFISYLDKKKFKAVKHHHYQQQHHQKMTFDPVPQKTTVYLPDGAGDDVAENMSDHSLETGTLAFHQQRFGSQIKNGKKCVTFDSAVRDLDASSTSDSIFFQLDNGFLGSTFNAASNTFNRNVSPAHDYRGATNVNHHSLGAPSVGHQAAANSSPTGMSTHIVTDHGHTAQLLQPDQVVDVALQKHNALVRSMRGNRRVPGANRQLRPSSSSHETDHCSSSSVETNDSGHGGSELDVSVIKMNV